MNRSIFNAARILHDNLTLRAPVIVRCFSYKSSLSLENLYPQSPQKITTPKFVPEDPNELFTGFIPIERLQMTYSCSSGPGGQNVNKVNTKVDLRFHVASADWLHPTVRDKLMVTQKSNINKDGYLIIKSDTTRYQQVNQADCMRKLRMMIRKAAEPEQEMSPETAEKLRKRREKAARERLMIKREASNRRSERQAPTALDL